MATSFAAHGRRRVLQMAELSARQLDLCRGKQSWDTRVEVRETVPAAMDSAVMGRRERDCRLRAR
jgi:hypothetical protein